MEFFLSFFLSFFEMKFLKDKEKLIHFLPMQMWFALTNRKKQFETFELYTQLTESVPSFIY